MNLGIALKNENVYLPFIFVGNDGFPSSITRRIWKTYSPPPKKRALYLGIFSWNKQKPQVFVLFWWLFLFVRFLLLHFGQPADLLHWFSHSSWGLLSLVSGPASLLSNIFNISPVPITTAQQKAKHQRSLKMPNGHSSQKRKTGHLSTFNQVLSQRDYTGFCFISKSPIGLDLIHPTLSYCILLDFLNLICCSLYH